MSTDSRKVIAVIGATGKQGSSVIAALQADGKFKTRAITRSLSKYSGNADEVIEADLTQPESLKKAFEGAYGVFSVTNFWEQGGINEVEQGEAAVNAAREAGVEHFIWSTLPNVEAITNGKRDVPHFTDKAKVDTLVANAGFKYHSYVMAPFYYQNLNTMMAPMPQQNGSLGWTFPIDPTAKVIHAGDISEIGKIVAGAFADPAAAGNGNYLPLVGDLLSYNDIVSTLNEQGHSFTFNQVPGEVFSNFFPGAKELAEMFEYFEEHTYLGKPSNEEIGLAQKLAGTPPTNFALWAQANMPVISEKAVA